MANYSQSYPKGTLGELKILLFPINRRAGKAKPLRKQKEYQLI